MRRSAVLLFTIVVAVMAVGIVERPVFAATITVNTTANDSTTNGNCTLREAITAANTNAAVDGCPAGQSSVTDTIEFNITGTGCDATSGVCTISSSTGLPDITAPVMIDGYTQPGASPNTLAVGNNAALQIVLSGPGAQSGVSGLNIEADNSTVQGLVISSWDNAVFLNVDTTGNTVRGNFIGTDATGAELGNNIGVVLTNALKNTIGGTTAAARNIISDNQIGISISGGTENRFQGNYIGTNAAGNTALGNFQGMVLSNSSNNTIGGATAGARNIISGNGSDGVEVRFDSGFDPEAATGNRILSNSIYDNSELGIDLVHSNNLNEEVSPNDPGDGDGGNPDANPPEPASAPNRLQNFPVITSAKLTTRRIGGHRRKVTLIRGTLNSWADKTYTVQFFSSLAADPSGFGEGQKFKGQKSVTDTDGDGIINFTFRTRKKVPNGHVVTATATDQSTDDTSEFSRACTVPGVPCPP